MILSILLMAIREILRHKFRSALTALGIVIGVGAVVCLVTVGEAMSAKVRSDVASMGNNLLFVVPSANRRGPVRTEAPPFSLADAVAIQGELAGRAEAAPVAFAQGLAVAGSNNHSTTAFGTTPNYLQVRGFQIETGRMFDESDAGSGVCVLGATVRATLFGSDDPIGQRLRFGNLSCEVVGVLVAKGMSGFGNDQDDLVLLPLRTVQKRIRGDNDVTSINVSVSSEGQIPRVISQIDSLMKERRRIGPGQEVNFKVHDMKEVAEAMQSITGTLTALLGAIAAVSLLVGGIGIMNIMLVSVTERTREIGIRMAIGAKAGEVLLQFLLEAVVLSLLGGLAGVILGLGGSYAAIRALELPPVFVPRIIFIAFGFSAMVGVGFGFFPARKAARLHPIQALRHE